MKDYDGHLGWLASQAALPNSGKTVEEQCDLLRSHVFHSGGYVGEDDRCALCGAWSKEHPALLHSPVEQEGPSVCKRFVAPSREPGSGG